jgi:sugar lactone lactonase YvrE
MKAEVWDARRCVLGEGPVVRGSEVFWVDILGKRVLSRNIESEQITEFDTHDHVSFVLPRAGGELMLGIADGPYLRDVDGALYRLPGRVEADGHDDPNPTRWNDAKVSPSGETWLGSMTYDVLPHEAALYRLSQDGASIKRMLSEVTLSNGLGWSRDGTRFFYIDTPTRRVDVFDVVSEGITNRRTFIDLSSTTGMLKTVSGLPFGTAERFGATTARLACSLLRLTCQFRELPRVHSSGHNSIKW